MLCVFKSSLDTRARIYKRFKEPRNRFEGIEFDSLCSWRTGTTTLSYSFPGPIDCSKIPAQLNFFLPYDTYKRGKMINWSQIWFNENFKNLQCIGNFRLSGPFMVFTFCLFEALRSKPNQINDSPSLFVRACLPQRKQLGAEARRWNS